MAHLIFVHGMNANAKSWGDVPNTFSASADSVTAESLPGHDSALFSPSALEGLLTQNLSKEDFFGNSAINMDNYVQSVKATIDKLPTPAVVGTPDVCLIGHSMGGMVISKCAEQFPDRISSLIYVCAMLPDKNDSAESIIDEIKAASDFDDSGFLKEFGPLLPGAASALVKQPQKPLASVFDRQAGFDNINKYYIRCLGDKIIPHSVQTKMLEKYPGAEQFELSTGHLPQYQNEQKLEEIIKGILSS